MKYFIQDPDEGNRLLTFMMLDEEVVAVSPSSVYRVLVQAGLMCVDDALEQKVVLQRNGICATRWSLGCSRYSTPR